MIHNDQICGEPMWMIILPETNIASENRPSQKESHLPTAMLFSRGELLVSGSVRKFDMYISKELRSVHG